MLGLVGGPLRGRHRGSLVSYVPLANISARAKAPALTKSRTKVYQVAKRCSGASTRRSNRYPLTFFAAVLHREATSTACEHNARRVVPARHHTCAQTGARPAINLRRLRLISLTPRERRGFAPSRVRNHTTLREGHEERSIHRHLRGTAGGREHEHGRAPGHGERLRLGRPGPHRHELSCDKERRRCGCYVVGGRGYQVIKKGSTQRRRPGQGHRCTYRRRHSQVSIEEDRRRYVF